MMNQIAIISQFLVFLTNLGLGILVLIKNPRGTANRYYFFFSLGLSLWSLSLFLTIIGASTPLLWGRLAFSFGSWMSSGLCLFALAVTKRKSRWLGAKGILWFLSAFFFIIFLTPLMITSVKAIGGYITGTFTPAYPLFVIYAPLFLIIGLFLLIRGWFRARGIERTQLTYIIIGVTFFIVTFQSTNLLLPLFFGIFQFNNLGPIFSIPMLGLISYAIIRHRFLDIRIVIQRGLLYSIAIGIVVILYFTSIFTLGEIFRKTTEITSLVSAVLAAIIVVIGFPYLKSAFQKATDKIFFRGAYNYPEVLRELSQTLSSTIDLEKLFASVGKIMKKSLKPKKIILLISDSNGRFQVFKTKNFLDEERTRKEVQNLIKFLEKNKEIAVRQELEYKIKKHPRTSRYNLQKISKLFKKLEVSLATPLFFQKELIGIFMLGEKLSEEPFSQEDLKLLSTFSNQAGVAIENAKLYEEVKIYSQELERKVRARTKELKRLYDAQSRFMTDISHRLQTPLSIIKGNIGMLHRRFQKSNAELKVLDTVDKTTDRMSRLVHDLLTLARADFGQQRLNMKAVGLNHLIKGIHEQFQILAKDKDIEFLLQEKNKLIVLGDREKLKELFLNLISNAIKYTPSGGKIGVTLCKEDGLAKIEVSDTGHGIPQKDLPHIFERFYRIERKRFPEDKGTGLGLAICQWIVRAHNGTITAESKLGKGSKFIVNLPRLDSRHLTG